jgi:hypothetical protein
MHDDQELTPAERDAFARLARTTQTSRVEEERAVRAMAAHGLLQLAWPRRTSRTWAWIGAAAACLVFFVAGFTFGQRRDAARHAQLASAPLDPSRAANGAQPNWHVATDSTRTTDTHYVVWF